MAISKLLPRKAGSKSCLETLRDWLDYDRKNEKTNGSELVSSYMCCHKTAAEGFETSKLMKN